MQCPIDTAFHTLKMSGLPALGTCVCLGITSEASGPGVPRCPFVIWCSASVAGLVQPCHLRMGNIFCLFFSTEKPEAWETAPYSDLGMRPGPLKHFQAGLGEWWTGKGVSVTMLKARKQNPRATLAFPGCGDRLCFHHHALKVSVETDPVKALPRNCFEGFAGSSLLDTVP